MSRAVLAGAVAFAALAVLGVVLLVVAPSSSDKVGGRPGALLWAEQPKLVYPPSLPTDRILYGQVRNDGLRDIKLRATDLRVLDRGGRPLRSDARFVQAYVHGMYPVYGPDKDIGDYERRRLGIALTLKPGRTAPLTIAWHGTGARTVQIGDVKLPVPVAP